MIAAVPVTVRAQYATDNNAVRAVLTNAFGTDGEHVADLAQALIAGPAQIALVAELDGELVGSIMLSRAWLDAPEKLVDVLVLSPLGVATRWQKRGVGAALVRAAVERAEETRSPLVFLEGEPGYYPRFGFAPGRPLGFSPPSSRIPDAAFQVLRLAAYESWMTGAFVYPDAFWRHDSVGLRSDD